MKMLARALRRLISHPTLQVRNDLRLRPRPRRREAHDVARPRRQELRSFLRPVFGRLQQAAFGAEYDERKAVYTAALAKIKAHNSDPTHTWKMGLSPHADKTEAEWKAMKGYNRHQAFSAPNPSLGLLGRAAPLAVEDLPDRVDWREKGVVSDVKDQGGCGSCWAFSATEVVESAVAIATGTLKKLAPQQYVDCAPNPDDCGGTGGCEGSTQWLAFSYWWVLDSPPKATTRTAAATACARRRAAAAHLSHQRLPANDYAALMNAVATVGPVAISVDAGWMMYEEGVYRARAAPRSTTPSASSVRDGPGRGLLARAELAGSGRARRDTSGSSASARGRSPARRQAARQGAGCKEARRRCRCAASAASCRTRATSPAPRSREP